jgi:hypothetical protein
MSGAYPLSCRSLVRPAIAFPSGMNCADECRYAQFMATINEEKKVLQVLRVLWVLWHAVRLHR